MGVLTLQYEVLRRFCAISFIIDLLESPPTPLSNEARSGAKVEVLANSNLAVLIVYPYVEPY